MSRSKCLLVACVWCSLCCVQVTSAVADFSPPGTLSPGDRFHWVFVTSTTRRGQDKEIEHHNDFVNEAADAVAGNVLNVLGINELGDIGWKVIASAHSPAVAAKGNIGDPMSPIYRFDGALVANDEGDLFDGTIANAINLTETGTIYENTSVYTGSTADGSRNSSFAMGEGGGKILAETGYIGNSSTTYLTGGAWIANGTSDVMNYHPFYAISSELTVVPLPGAVLLGILGLMSSSVVLAKRK